LNPMLNPTLGRNLGRWAHVYFTSPPEKREQAVLELLRELEAESSAGETQGPLNGTSNSMVSETRMIPETVVCAECGHQNAKLQRFCGMCGSPLTFDGHKSDERTAAELPSIAGQLRGEPDPAVMRDTVFPTLSLFAQVGEETSGNRDSDIQWLRDRDSEEESATSPALKYVLVVLVILLAGAFFYSRSRTPGARGPGEQGASGVWTGGGSSAPPVRPQSGSSASTPENVNTGKLDVESRATSLSNPVTPKEAAPAESSARHAADSTSPIPVADADTRRPTANPAPTPHEPAATPQQPAATMNGSSELAMAEEYLTGKRGPRNTAVAATFLWKAVSKENTTAILLLSDLYRTGDGVPKSCDQARLLLYAAARKNVPEAGQKLRDLQVGCH
jgi:TPR repeat protein